MNNLNTPQKIFVPFSKGNEEKKEPIPQKIFLTIGPVEISLVALYLSQLEDQGWSTEHVLFGGVVQSNRMSLLPQQSSVPVHHIIVAKVHKEGEELIQPLLTNPKG